MAMMETGNKRDFPFWKAQRALLLFSLCFSFQSNKKNTILILFGGRGRKKKKEKRKKEQKRTKKKKKRDKEKVASCMTR